MAEGHTPATEKKDEVSAKHASYDKIQMQRQKWQDVIEGTLKLREKKGEYLPQFPAENGDSYSYRCATATLFNLTRKTRDVMTGLVFQSEIILGDDVDETIVKLAENIDNTGKHLNVFAREIFEDAFEGYAAILVDAPSAAVMTLEEERILQIRPYFVAYKADQIINWRYRVNKVSKAKELSLIVLREVSEEPAGNFINKETIYYRVFFFADNIVNWNLFREVQLDSGQKEYALEIRGDSPKLTQLPVAILRDLGSTPPFLDIALKNIEHFQTYSGDYKAIIHKTCAPLLFAKGIEIKEGEKFIISPDVATRLSDTGDMGYAEPSGASIEGTRQCLIDIREDISLMGLSILADKTAKVDITATEALLNNIGETAEIRVMAISTKDAIELAFGHMAEYLGLKREAGGSITLGTAWASQQGATLRSEADLVSRLDAANKADGLLPHAEQLKIIYPDKTDEEIAEIIGQVAKEQAVRDNNQML